MSQTDEATVTSMFAAGLLIVALFAALSAASRSVGLEVNPMVRILGTFVLALALSLGVFVAYYNHRARLRR